VGRIIRPLLFPASVSVPLKVFLACHARFLPLFDRRHVIRALLGLPRETIHMIRLPLRRLLNFCCRTSPSWCRQVTYNVSPRVDVLVNLSPFPAYIYVDADVRYRR